MRTIALAAVLAATAVSAAGLATTASPAPAAPTLLLKSAISLDSKGATVTLPLFKGYDAKGGAVWYIVTDSSSRADAAKRGVNFSPKLRNALSTKAVQRARKTGTSLDFAGTVNFRPKVVVVPSQTGFPPTKVAPGAIGDRSYSPLVTTGDGVVLNASHIANSTGRSDSVVSLDTKKRQVTLKLLSGFFAGRTVHYLRVDASVDVVAALEGSTLAKNLDAAPGAGSNGPGSARSAIVPIVNGARGKANPEQQGLQSAVLDGISPLNITQSLPGGKDYSPIWDVHPAVWSAGVTPKRLTSTAQVIAAIKAGQLGSGGGGPANASLAGLKAAPFISNCPTIAID